MSASEVRGLEATVGEVDVRLEQVCRPVGVNPRGALDALPDSVSPLEAMAVGSRRNSPDMPLAPGDNPAPFRSCASPAPVISNGPIAWNHFSIGKTPCA
jgi:hypothetical protein